MDKRCYEAVLFDLDGVLVDTESITFEIWGRHLKKQYGIKLEPWHYLRAAGMMNLRFADGIEYHFPGVDTRPMVQAWEQEMAALAQSGQIRIKKGFCEIMTLLRRHDIKRGIVTANGSEWLPPILQQLDAHNQFDIVITAADVQCLKPSPDAYLLAAQRLGVKSEKCFVLEDSSLGVEAGLAAGMAVGRMRDIAPVEAALLERCIAEFDDLEQVAKYMGAMWNFEGRKNHEHV